MASRNRVGSENDEILTLHEMFEIVGGHLTSRDVDSLKYLYKPYLTEEIQAQIHDGFTFLLALEKIKRVDESNFKFLLDLLKIITRHDLTQYVTLRKRRPVLLDPVDTYLEARFKSRVIVPFSRKRPSNQLSNHTVSTATTSISEKSETIAQHSEDVDSIKPASDSSVSSSLTTERHNKTFEELEEQPDHPLMALPPDESTWIPPNKRRKTDRSKKSKTTGEEEGKEDAPSKKITCDIRLRVRAEYCNHQSVLEGNVFSTRPTKIERQFEKFLQANTILKSRDLGSIHCDIKFSELTYLDAFWRDYVNGALLEALKGVFITESLKQAVGHEAIKLLVNVDEDDYNNGRLKLLQNLLERHQHSPV